MSKKKVQHLLLGQPYLNIEAAVTDNELREAFTTHIVNSLKLLDWEGVDVFYLLRLPENGVIVGGGRWDASRQKEVFAEGSEIGPAIVKDAEEVMPGTLGKPGVIGRGIQLPDNVEILLVMTVGPATNLPAFLTAN